MIEKCRKWIEDALEYNGGFYDFDDVAKGITSGQFQLWPADDACLVTELLQFPRKRAVNVFLAGGNLERLEDMHKDVLSWAQAQGCECALLSGRIGWARALKRFGWTPIYQTCKLDFE